MLNVAVRKETARLEKVKKNWGIITYTATIHLHGFCFLGKKTDLQYL
jgi:hypothetical protein